ncbi:hypothetical protein [Parabacteroides sp. TM07-1AC]|nr:hypothetical protein [Parabacteroides sp. TM07-1AC]
MAVQYHLVLRKNMSKEVEAGKEKLYMPRRVQRAPVALKNYAI